MNNVVQTSRRNLVRITDRLLYNHLQRYMGRCMMRSTARPIALLLAGVCLAPALPAAAAVPADDGPVILVQPQHSLAPVSPALTGVNNDQWFGNAHGLWDPEADAPNPDVVAKTRRAGIGIVRFPGGTSANLYDWKR